MAVRLLLQVTVLLTRKTSIIVIHISCKYDYDPHVYGINYMYKKILTCIIQYIICVCAEYTYIIRFHLHFPDNAQLCTNIKKFHISNFWKLTGKVSSLINDYTKHILLVRPSRSCDGFRIGSHCLFVQTSPIIFDREASFLILSVLQLLVHRQHCPQ